MSKVSALQASLEKSAGKASKSRGEPQAPPAVSALTPAPAGQKVTAPRKAAAPSREGKIHIGAYLPADFKRSLRLVQAQTGEDMQTLLTRALNDLFKSHNVPIVEG